MTDLVERCTRHLLQVKCRRCGAPAYPHKDGAKRLVENLIEHNQVASVDDLEAHIDLICSGCDEMLSRDD
jgi:hypothetical protein